MAQQHPKQPTATVMPTTSQAESQVESQTEATVEGKLFTQSCYYTTFNWTFIFIYMVPSRK